MMRKTVIAGVIAASIAGAGPLRADELRIIIPFTPGGTDLIARPMLPDLKELLGQTVIIDTRGGAGGILGTTLAANAKPDGNTVLMGTLGSQVIAAAINGKTSYHPLRSFEPIAMVGRAQIVLVTRIGLQVDNLQDLVRMVKGGAKLSFASSGQGTTTQIALELFKLEAGIDITHVPYRGGGPAIADIAAGHVDLYSGDVFPLLGQLQARTVRPIAIFDTRRAAQIPDVPTSGEQGYPGALMSNWYGIVAPIGITTEMRDRLEKAFLTVLRSPHISERLTSTGLTGPLGAADFRKVLEAEVALWPGRIEKMGLKEP